MPDSTPTLAAVIAERNQLAYDLRVAEARLKLANVRPAPVIDDPSWIQSKAARQGIALYYLEKKLKRLEAERDLWKAQAQQEVPHAG